MQQFLINPATHERVYTSEANGKILRKQGWKDARPADTSAVPADHGRSGIIVQALRASDYDAAPTERIAAFLESGNLEYAEGVLDYETSHLNRPHVLRLVNARIDTLTDELVQRLRDRPGEPDTPSERPAPNASRGDWNTYAASIGLDPEAHSSKDDLIKAVDDQEANGNG